MHLFVSGDFFLKYTLLKKMYCLDFFFDRAFTFMQLSYHKLHACEIHNMQLSYITLR